MLLLDRKDYVCVCEFGCVCVCACAFAWICLSNLASVPTAQHKHSHSRLYILSSVPLALCVQGGRVWGYNNYCLLCLLAKTPSLLLPLNSARFWLLLIFECKVLYLAQNNEEVHLPPLKLISQTKFRGVQFSRVCQLSQIFFSWSQTNALYTTWDSIWNVFLPIR